jgi:uncharacterized protein
MTVAWITGGGTGIGRALAEAFYRDAYRVVISGRRQEVLAQAAQEINAAKGPGEVWAIAGDVGEVSYASELYRTVQARWGVIDILINNAGVNTYHSFQEASSEEYEQNFRDNCLSAIRCTKAVLPAMRARQSGAIVNISSILGRWASPTASAYSVTKYALSGFTDALRQELAGTGVHVMGVYPGFIRTPMTLPFVSPNSRRRHFGKSPESMAAAIVAALKRKKRTLFYPWYVPLALHLHDLFPGALESLRKYFDR